MHSHSFIYKYIEREVCTLFPFFQLTSLEDIFFNCHFIKLKCMIISLKKYFY